MPLRRADIFADLPEHLRETVNPYLAKVKAAQKSDLPLLFGSDLRGKKGRWNEFFASRLARSPQRLWLEIGVHNGKVLAELAALHRSDAFLGMDITFKRVFASAKRLKEQGLGNGAIVLGNAKALAQIFAPGELHGVLVFFPDPWSKKSRQKHNRLLSKEFCALLHLLIKANGNLWLKTDNHAYFCSVNKWCENLGFEALGERPFAGELTSSFERRFQQQKVPTYQTIWRRCP